MEINLLFTLSRLPLPYLEKGLVPFRNYCLLLLLIHSVLLLLLFDGLVVLVVLTPTILKKSNYCNFRYSYLSIHYFAALLTVSVSVTKICTIILDDARCYWDVSI